jgi:hypothetical protein
MLIFLHPTSLKLLKLWNKPQPKTKMYNEPPENDTTVTVIAVILTTLLSLITRLGTVFLGTVVAVWTLRWMGVSV